MKNLKHVISTSALVLAILMLSSTSSMLATIAAPSSVETLNQQSEAFRYPQSVTNNPWKLQSYSDGANALTPSPGPQTNHTLWKVVGLPALGCVVAYGRVFAECAGDINQYNPYNSIVCLDAYTGEIIWEHTALRPSDSTMGYCAPVVDDSYTAQGMGYVYAGFNGSLCCFAAFDGALLWQVTPEQMAAFVPGLALGNYLCSVGPIFGANIIFAVGDWNTYVFAVNRFYGTIVWATDMGGASAWKIGNIPMADGKLYIADYAGVMHCLNATTGQTLWTTTTNSTLFASMTMVANGKVYAGTNPPLNADGPTYGVVYCFDADTGKILWEYDKILGACRLNICYNASKVYVGSGSLGLYCLDADTGNLEWNLNTACWGIAKTLADGNVYLQFRPPAGTSLAIPNSYAINNVVGSGGFYCLNQDTGNLVWQYMLPNGSSSYPVDCPVVDGIAYAVFDHPPGLYAFGIGPTTTEVSVTDANVAKGTGTAIYGRVYDESPASSGAPVSGVPVELMLQKTGDSSWTGIATATTDSMGHFVTQWTPQSEGTYTVMAKFNGNNAYGWSSKTAVVYASSAQPSNIATSIDWYLIAAAAAIVVIVIVVAAVFLRRRTK